MSRSTARNRKEEIKRKFALSRRSFMGGAGAILALPYLHSLLPKDIKAQAVPKPQRFVFYFQPTGFFMENWVPKVSGNDVALPQTMSPILSPLSDIRAKSLVLQGLGNFVPGQVHELQTVGILSCADNDGATVNDTTVDQIIANNIGQYTVVPSLQLGLYNGGSQPVSWASKTKALPAVGNPKVVFDTLFRGYDPTATAEQQALRSKYDKSVIDYVIQDTQSLANKLGNDDKQKMDEYFSSVRELELRVAKAESSYKCAPSNTPADEPGNNFDRQKRVNDMMDLIVLALKCDITRVVTFDFQDGNMSYPWLGFSDNHHNLSHSSDAGDATASTKYEAIGKWHIEQYAYLVKQMDSINEDGGTVLDNSMVYLNSEISFNHNRRDLPVIITGSNGGKLKTGRFVRFKNPIWDYNGKNYENQYPLADLYVTMMNTMGINQDKFADSDSKKLTELLNA